MTGLDRTQYLGSADAASACGVSPWSSPFQTYLFKVGDETERPSSLPMRAGMFLQPFIASEFELETGLTCHSPEQHFVHPDHPFIQCHTDYLTAEGGETVVVECKHSGRYFSDLPIQYHVQIQQQLACAGLRRAYAAVLFAGNTLKVFEIEADEAAQRHIIERMVWLWDCVQQRTPPPVETPEDVRLKWPHDDGDEKVADSQTLSLLNKLVQARENLKTIEAEKKLLEAQVQSFMSDASYLVDESGARLATWKNAKCSKRFDAKRFTQENPDLAECYSVEVEGSRRFTLRG